MDTTFRTLLYEARRRRNLSRASLAYQVEVSEETIRRWELGEYEPRRPEVARRLDAVLGTQFETLLFGSPIPDGVAVPSADDIEAVKREQERLRFELAQLKLAFGLLSDPRRGGPVRRGVPPLVTTP